MVGATANDALITLVRCISFDEELDEADDGGGATTVVVVDGAADRDALITLGRCISRAADAAVAAGAGGTELSEANFKERRALATAGLTKRSSSRVSRRVRGARMARAG